MIENNQNSILYNHISATKSSIFWQHSFSSIQLLFPLLFIIFFFFFVHFVFIPCLRSFNLINAQCSFYVPKSNALIYIYIGISFKSQFTERFSLHWHGKIVYHRVLFRLFQQILFFLDFLSPSQLICYFVAIFLNWFSCAKAE